MKAYEKPTCYKILVYSHDQIYIRKLLEIHQWKYCMVYEKRFLYHDKYDILSTYCLWFFHICNSINHLEKGTPLNYKICINHLKTENLWLSIGFHEFHLSFQKDYPPFCKLVFGQLDTVIILKRFSCKEFMIMLLNMTTVPLNNWGFIQRLENHSNWNLTLILYRLTVKP